MSAGAASPFSVFAFLASRTFVNAARIRFRRLKEPRYLVGLLFGILYFGMTFGRSAFRQGRVGSQGIPKLPPEVPPILLLAGSFALGILMLAGWLLRRGEPSLALTETELQFLFPAPLPSRAVLHYALLRTQIGLLFSSLIVTLVIRRNFSGSGLRMTIGIWILLSVLQFHLKALAFTKARWRERSARGRTLATAALVLVVLALLALFVSGAASGIDVVKRGLEEGTFQSLTQLAPAIRSTPAGTASLFLLWPIRLVLAPLVATSTQTFLVAALSAFPVLVLHYLWLAATAIGYEEATIESAGRRALSRLRRKGEHAQPSIGFSNRDRVPFRLAPSGAPEIAIFWKNLVASSRASGKRFAAGTFLGLLLLWAAAALAVVLRSDSVPFVFILAAAGAGFLLLSAIFVPFGSRNDLRGDLENVELLRQWPLSPLRLVAAELAAPWFFSTVLVWTSLALALAISGGVGFGLAHQNLAAASVDLPKGAFGSWLLLGKLVPISLGLAVAIPALVAMALVVQNGAVLTFPAWFPPGRQRSVGLEATGMRMVSFIVTSLLLLVALIPAALLVVPLAYFGWRTLGFWIAPLSGLLIAAPLVFETGMGLLYLAKLFDLYDPSREMGG